MKTPPPSQSLTGARLAQKDLAKRDIRLRSSFQFHMAIGEAALLAVSIIGCRVTQIHVDIAGSSSGFFMAFLMLAIITLYWKEEDRSARFASILVVPWILLLIPLMIFPMLVAGHIGMPLQDARLARFDHLFRVDVPSIAAWANQHWAGRLISDSYPLLIFLMAAAVLVPIVGGKTILAREFILANLAAIALGLTSFCLIPAIGPWYPHRFHPTPAQSYCQHAFLALRTPGPYHVTQPAAVVCFPSFHVIWAILSVAALWCFRPLRIPLGLLSIAIILSTMTTGWHYFADVVAGIVIAALSIAFAKLVSRKCYAPIQTGQARHLNKPLLRHPGVAASTDPTV
jgi:membrane-associated phospholipid phosphatase